jgi:pSer/pThr/pTyr-binding forkhead associated (FHA) protein
MAIVVIISDRENTHKLTMNAGTFTLGRSSSCHVSLVDPMVSGKHLTLALNQDNRVVVKDLHSSNGTFLNGSKVGESIVELDDEITVGDVRIWIDESSLTSQERNFHGRATQKTKLKFIDLGQELSNTNSGINQPLTNSEISISMKFKPSDLEEKAKKEKKKKKESPVNDHPQVETLTKEEFKQQTRSIKISREGATRSTSFSTKNDEKGRESLGSKIKNLWKK